MSEAAAIVSVLPAAPSKDKRAKRLEAGCRVSGSFGDYVPNPNPNIKRRIRMKLYGTIVRAVDKKQYEVLWDNNKTAVVFANSLAKETSFASLPPSSIPLRRQDNPEMPPTGQEAADAEEEEIIDSQRDQEATEHLPFAGQPVGGCFSSDEEDEPMEEASVGESPAVGGQVEGGGGVESSSRPRKRQAQAAVDDPEGRMPGQLPTAEALPKDYTQRKSDAVSLVKSMLGREVVIKHKAKSMKWLVVEPFDVEDNNNNNIAPAPVGLKHFKSTDYPKETVFAELFLHLAFADWRVSLSKINDAVAEHNNNNPAKKKVRPFSEQEFLSGLGVFIGAAEFGIQGMNLWREGDQVGQEVEEWQSMVPHPEFDKIIKLYRWKECRAFLPYAFQSQKLKDENDPWWRFEGAIQEFNNNRFDRIQIARWLCIDESMSAWRPRTTPTGGLPNISFILRKPEPLGKFFCCFLLFFNFKVC
jgi:hypothetical protein